MEKLIRRKSLKQFIRENRVEIDKRIRQINPKSGSLRDGDRRFYLSGNRELREWAKSEGVADITLAMETK